MRKYHIVLLGMFLCIFGGLFRYNILGFYHEVLLDEVVDLGGHGVEKVEDVVVDEENNMYVLSRTIDGFTDVDGFVQNFEHFLVTKINSKHKVVESYLVDELIDQYTINYIARAGKIELDKNDEPVVLLQYEYWNRETYEDLSFFLRLNKELDVLDESQITLDERYLLPNLTVDEDSRVHLFSREGKVFIFDKDFQLIDEKVLAIDPFTVIYDVVYDAGSWFFLGKEKESANYMYVLFQYNMDSDLYEVVEYMTNRNLYYELTSDYILYAPYIGDRWDQESLEVTYQSLHDEEDTFTLNINIPNIDNQVANVKYNDGCIYVYGFTMTSKRSDATYYAYNLDGELVEEYISNIGGLDSMNNLYFIDETVIPVIASKRVVNYDYIRRYTQAYDHIIKFID